jgi:hypothetical protein
MAAIMDKIGYPTNMVRAGRLGDVGPPFQDCPIR